MSVPMRLCPRFRRLSRVPCLSSPSPLLHSPSPPPIITLLHRFHPSEPSRFSTFTAQVARGLRPLSASDVEDPVDEETDETEKEEAVAPPRKSRNEKKREARRAVRWGMDLAKFPPPHIKRILSVVSAEKEVYEAIMLVKMFGPDVREGRRRQFSYIGKLLRDVEPQLMDSLIQASKDCDNSKLQSLMGPDTRSSEDEEEEIDSEDEHQDSINAASRWLEGLITKDPDIVKEVYSLHNVEFDRQELRKLVRRVQTTENANNDKESEANNAASGKARNSLFIFLRRIANQSLTDV